MKEQGRTVLRCLDREELLVLVGGDGFPGGSFANDLGWLIGTVVGGLATAWSLAPESSYAYGKIGYGG